MINYDTVTQRHQISPHAQAFQKKTTLGWAQPQSPGWQESVQNESQWQIATGHWQLGVFGYVQWGLGVFLWVHRQYIFSLSWSKCISALNKKNCTKFVLQIFAVLGGSGMTESIEFGLLVLKSPELVNLPGYRAGWARMPNVALISFSFQEKRTRFRNKNQI